MANECVDIITEANAGRLSDDEIEQLVADLNEVRKTRGATEGVQSIESAMFEKGQLISEEALLAAQIEKRNAYINVMKESELMSLVRAADSMTDDPSLGLEAALVGVNAPFEGASRSVDALAGAIGNSYAGGLIGDLRKGNLLTQFNTMNGNFAREVSRVLADLNSPNPKGVEASADARSIASLMHKYQRAAIDRENRAGAYIRSKTGYVVRQNHNPARIAKVGREGWKDAVRTKLDWEVMDIPVAKREEFLDSAYSSLESGVRLDTQKTDIAHAFRGPGNLAKKESASRVLEFRSADDWFDYDQQFGHASLREAFMGDLMRSAKSTALMEKFGTNPQAMLDRVTQRLQQDYRTDPKKLKRIKREGVNALTLQAAMDEVTGDVNLGSHQGVARVMSGYRAVQTMSKLGAAWVSALSDVAFVATNRVYQGRSMMGAWQDSFSAVFKGLEGGEKRIMADYIGVGLEGQLGDFMARFNASDDIPGRTSKMMASFFKLNLLGPWSDANKRGATFMIARDLAINSTKAFDKLPDDLQRLLRIYGLDAKTWEVARLAVKEGPDGKTYMMPGDVDGVRGKPFSGLSQPQQQKLRDQVRESLFALMVTEADASVPSPGARERAILRRGYRPGTTAGEAIRFITQFKSFGVTAMSKVVGRQVYGAGSKTLRDQLAKGVGANLGLVNAVVGTTMLGYFVMQAKEMMKGREPRPLTKETFVAAMAQGGGLGIYGDFLFGNASRYGGGTLETFAGPGIGTLADVVDILQRARGIVEGGEEDLRGDVLRLAKSNVPFANLFYVKGAFDYLLWYQMQEMLNPGYLKRMERRVERENNQQYWLPPSSVVKTGGGFR